MAIDEDLFKTANLSQKVYEHLKTEIYSGRFPSTEPIYETHLAEELGVSRTPVREAILKLENEGLVKQVKNQGVRARTITQRDIQDAFRSRTAIEVITVELAAERITDIESKKLDAILDRTNNAIRNGLLGEVMKENERFHHFIASCTGNSLMEQLIARVYDYIRAHRLLQSTIVQKIVRDTQETIYREHYEIAEAIKAHDTIAAAVYMQKHLEEVSLRYQESLHG